MLTHIRQLRQLLRHLVPGLLVRFDQQHLRKHEVRSKLSWTASLALAPDLRHLQSAWESRASRKTWNPFHSVDDPPTSLSTAYGVDHVACALELCRTSTFCTVMNCVQPSYIHTSGRKRLVYSSMLDKSLGKNILGVILAYQRSYSYQDRSISSKLDSIET